MTSTSLGNATAVAPLEAAEEGGLDLDLDFDFDFVEVEGVGVAEDAGGFV